MTDFDDVVARLFRQNEFAIKYDLDAMTQALALLALPRPARRTVIVAGTNGKGSTSARLNALAIASGQTVGLFTSPHLVDIRERIRVAGRPIPKETFAGFMGRLLERFGDPELSEAGRALTYFELLTLTAWSWFSECDLDVAIFEVGLGGRLDATNVVDADIAVFTALGLDHVEYLGETLPEIASEKAAVARPGRSAWLHPQNPGSAELKTALERIGPKVRSVTDMASADPMDRNRALAEAVWAAEFGLVHERLSDIAMVAHSRFEWPGRRDVRVWHGQTWWLDGAHNVDAMNALVPWLRARTNRSPCAAVISASPGRELNHLFAPIAHLLGSVQVCPASSFRSAQPEDIAAALRRLGVADVRCHPDADSAFRAARAATALSQPILVTGSLYLVGHWFESAGFTADSLTVYRTSESSNRS